MSDMLCLYLCSCVCVGVAPSKEAITNLYAWVLLVCVLFEVHICNNKHNKKVPHHPKPNFTVSVSLARM